MVSIIVVAIVAALCCTFVQRMSIPRVDDSLASGVILGVKHDDGSQLPPVYGHRGCGFDAPENTLAAFQEAKKNGASGIEFDLSFTRDNVAVIFHDETLERTTNGKGLLKNITFDELRQLDASCKHPLADRFPGQRVPTLEEAVDECLRLDMRMIIDVKDYDFRAVDVVDQLFRRRTRVVRTCAGCLFQPSDTNNTRPRHPAHVGHWFAIMSDWLLDKALHTGFLPYLTGASAVLISTNMMSVGYVKAWRDMGLHVIAWTPNHPAEKNFLRQSLGVSIITDTMQGTERLSRAGVTWLLVLSVVIAASARDAPSTSTSLRPLKEQSGRRTADKEAPGSPRPAETSGYPTTSGHTAAAAASTARGYKSHGFYDVYQGYDKGFSDIVYWVPLIIIFGAGIIFLPVLGALFATFAAGTAGAAVSTTVAGRRRRRRELPSLDAALDALSALEKAIEKFRSAS
ncbi:hypothetical protein HPB50_000771 [Hyalomma asiaticum]|uniref:Uncharacterized protein n=1 Tax=Hyalomma asiaticum TaxID=266040 RepID=A0ACB7SUQ6_HYAAI|nr:hypothetical protein HPB50_000771 [Hyalomma asiaticum]